MPVFFKVGLFGEKSVIIDKTAIILAVYSAIL
jgi:mevalonate kinase